MKKILSVFLIITLMISSINFVYAAQDLEETSYTDNTNFYTSDIEAYDDFWCYYIDE